MANDDVLTLARPPQLAAKASPASLFSFNFLTPEMASEITPETAALLLKDRHHNRPMREQVVRGLVGDIVADRFLLNGATIVLCPEGRLLNGQHRCEAIRRAGRPVRVFVILGISPDHRTWATMDAGAKRTTSDAIAHEGRKHGATTAAIARVAVAHVANSFSVHRTTPELLAFIEANPYLEEISARVVGHNRTVIRGPFGAVVFLANNKHQLEDEAEAFMDGVLTGANLKVGDPRLTLRNWFAMGRGMSTKRGATTAEQAFTATVRAWNAFVEGREMTTIRLIQLGARIEIIGFSQKAFAGQNIRIGPRAGV